MQFNQSLNFPPLPFLGLFSSSRRNKFERSLAEKRKAFTSLDICIFVICYFSLCFGFPVCLFFSRLYHFSALRTYLFKAVLCFASVIFFKKNRICIYRRFLKKRAVHRIFWHMTFRFLEYHPKSVVPQRIR